MKKLPCILASFLATASLSACSMHSDDAQTTQAPVSMTQNFVTEASISDMFEIKSSQLAMKKSNDPQIRSLAQQMIADHMKSSAKLQTTLAAENSSAQPATMLDAKHQEILNNLKSTKKSEFKAMYLDAQENAHNEAISLFETYASTGKDANVRAFASDTLPVLKMHLQHVENLESM